MGGKSSSETIGYKNYAGAALVLAKLVHKIKKIRIADQDAWEGSIEAEGTIEIDKPKLYGVNGTEGGFVGTIAFQPGLPTQLPDSYLLSQLGPDISASRGVSQIVLRQPYLGNNPYIKDMEFNCERIHLLDNGDVQWYDSKAAVGFNRIREAVSNPLAWADRGTDFFNVGGAQETSGGYTEFQSWFNGYIGGLRVTKGVARYLTTEYEVPSSAFAADGAGDIYWANVVTQLSMNGEDASTSIVCDKGNAVTANGGAALSTAIKKFGTASCYFDGVNDWLKVIVGAANQDLGETYTIDGWVYQVGRTSNDNGGSILSAGALDIGGFDTNFGIHGELAHYVQYNNTGNPATSFSVSGALEPVALGEWVFLSICRDGSADKSYLHVGGLLATGRAEDSDINPAHVIRECLTNPEWGFGYDNADIDDASFMLAADNLFAENFGIGYLWDDTSTQLDAIINKVTEIIDGNLYVDRNTLKWTLTLVRNDYNPESLIELRTDYEVASIKNYARPEFLELKNTIIVQYYNPGVEGNGSITASNAALFLQQGVRIAETKNYEMCCNPELAAILAQRELDIASTPLSSCEVITNSAAKDLRRGSVFKLTSPQHNYNQTIMRVTDVTRGDSTTNQIKLKVVEDRFAMPQAAFIIPQPPAWVDPASLPQPITNRIAIEVPYAFLLAQETQQSIDAMLASDPDVGFFGVAGARVSGATSANIYADAGAGYEDVAKLDFCPYGELDADISYLTNALTLVNTKDLSELIDGAVFQIDGELIGFASNASGVLTGLKRGVLDSVPKPHVAGAKVFFIQGYLDGPERQYADGETVSVKLATNASKGQLAVSAAPVDAVAFASRASRPYAPGNVKLNAIAYPASITGALTVTWAHRNRLGQADSIVGTTEASVTPEVNTRYTLEFYNASDVLIIARSNIGPATADVVLNYTGDVTLKLWSVSDNGASIQRHEFIFAYTPPGGTTTSSITATDYTPVDDATIIDGGGD